MKTETKERVTIQESTSVYNPHYYIEIDEIPAIHIYEDAFNSRAQAHNVAMSIYLKLHSTFKVILFFVLLIPALGFSQVSQEDSKTNYFVAGFQLGYSFKANLPTSGISIGYKFNKAYLSANTIIPLSSDATKPIGILFNAGYDVLEGLQPFVSYGYFSIGKVSEAYFKNTPDAFKNKWYAGAGVNYYFKSLPLCLTAQKQAKDFNLSLTLYKAL